MSTILEHFKPPPLASDPPAKTKFWPAPPKGSTGGILQRPKPESNVSISVSASSSSSMLSVPPTIPPPSPSVTSSRVSFAPLPDLATRKRRNSITLGVAARSAALQRMKEQRNGPLPRNMEPQSTSSAGGEAGAGPRPQPHPRSNSASLGRRSGAGSVQYTYASYQAGQPRPRRPASKDDQVVDLGEVARDAGKKLWRVVSGKKEKGRKSSGAASDSGRPAMGGEGGVGGPTVGASGHNTEREILVRGFAVPEEIVDEEEDEDEEARQEDVAKAQAEAQHRTEDYVAGIQTIQLYDDDAEDTEGFVVDPSAVSPTEMKAAEGIEPSAIHSTRLSPPPPPPLTPESEVSDLTSADGSLSSSLTSPNVKPHSIDDPPNGYITEP